MFKHKRPLPGRPKPNTISSVREENPQVKSLSEVSNDNQPAAIADKTSKPAKGGLGSKTSEPAKGGLVSAIVRKVRKAACLCEPIVVESEITDQAQPQAPFNPYKGSHEEFMDKQFKELNEQIDRWYDKTVAKRSRKAEAARKEKERQELKRAEIRRKEEFKAAKRARIKEVKEAERERKARKKARKLGAKKLRGQEDQYSSKKPALPANSPLPPSPRLLPPGSPHFERIRAALAQASNDINDDTIPAVEELPLNPANDGGLPSQRQSPVALHRHSRSSSPARVISPSSSVTRLSTQASRSPHPPGLPRTDYLSSTGRAASWRSNKAGSFDNTGEKPRFSRHGSGGTDINANSLSNLHVKYTALSKLQQQTRQQPLPAIQPQPPSKALSRFQSTNQRYYDNDDDDLSNDLGNLHLDDSSGSVSSKSSSRRSSFTMGQRSRGSAVYLRCLPIVGASPSVTRHSISAIDSEYKPNFASSPANQSPLDTMGSVRGLHVATKSWSKLGVVLNEPISDNEREKSSSGDSSFSSAQHSVLGTGRTGVFSDQPDKAGMHGLNNIGNTCFTNSILQCLSQNKTLRKYFLTDEYLKNINYKSPGEGKLVKYFASVIKQLWDPKRKDCVTQTNLEAAFAGHFDVNKQHDAQEFLCYLLSELHDEMNTAPKRPCNITDIPDDIPDDIKAYIAWDRYCTYNYSIFSHLFVGQLKSTLECQTCKNRSVTFDIFWDLSITVPEHPRPFQRHATRERDLKLTKDTFDIKDCLNKFTEAEILDGDNMVTCDHCKEKRVFTKAISIQRFPKYLVLHLKRFSGLGAKLTAHVDFPLQGLDMSKYMAEDNGDLTLADRTKCHYNLRGVSQHSGSMLEGHYIACTKHLDSNKWNCYDDGRVESITEASVPSSYAYILFYKQVEQ